MYRRLLPYQAERLAAHLFRPSLDPAHKDALLINVMYVDHEFIQALWYWSFRGPRLFRGY